MRLKKVLLMIIVISVSFCMFQCKKSNSVKRSDQNLILLLKDIGKKHNDGLAYAFSKLKARPSRNKVTESARLSSTIETSLETQTATPLNVALDYTIDYAQISLTDFTFDASDLTSTLQSTVITGNEPYDLYVDLSQSSEQLVRFTCDLSSVISGYAESAEFESKLTQIRDEYLSQLTTDEEKIAVISAVNVALSSYQYWSANIDSWRSLLLEKFPIDEVPMTPGSGSPTSKKFAYDDAIGAISGAINGAVEGTVLGPGGSLAGGILGAATGAIYGSVGSAISDWVWERWFKITTFAPNKYDKTITKVNF
jgi:hypothetical protein